MTTGPDQEALAEFCASLPRLRGLLSGPASADRRAALEQAALAARRGEPIEPYLSRFGVPDPPDLFSPTPWRGPLPTALVAEPHPVTGVYVCPMGSCNRADYRRAGSDLPRCHVYEFALRFVPDE